MEEYLNVIFELKISTVIRVDLLPGSHISPHALNEKKLRLNLRTWQIEKGVW
jgi:hypothetical protein